MADKKEITVRFTGELSADEKKALVLSAFRKFVRLALAVDCINADTRH